jgi:hypothetical protein
MKINRLRLILDLKVEDVGASIVPGGIEIKAASGNLGHVQLCVERPLLIPQRTSDD